MDDYTADDFTEIEPVEPEAEEQSVSPEEFVAYVTQAENLAADMDDRELAEIAQRVVSDYDMDKESMSDWFERMDRGLKLASLVKEDKTYPFDRAANVKYPLITSAALQFNARSYPAIVPADRAVRSRVWGSDEGGKKAARAERVSEHMSWQLASQVEEWEVETDKLLLQLPIVGECFRKWWFDPVRGRPVCRLIEPGKLIVNDAAKSLTSAPRASEEIPLYPVEIESRIRSGYFVEFEYSEEGQDKQEPQDFIEQHTRIDLDKDGYEEPYVVTVHVKSQKIVRLVADFMPEDVNFQTEQQMVPQAMPMMDPLTNMAVEVMQLVPQEVATGIISIQRGTYFVGFTFIPAMDGGFHGTGLGLLLGDISESINTIINMLLDAGHYASLGGGFIGSEFRMKGGSQSFRPGEWKMTQANGADIKSSIVPLTFPGPDGTLFQMLGMLIDAGREIASVQNIITGEQPRQAQTATTTLALIEQGMMVFTAAYKRIYRSLREEYALLARLNARTVDPQAYAAFHDEEGVDPQADYNMADMDIQPVADPRSVTKMQQAAKAQLLLQLAEQGLVDKGEALARVAEAMDIEDVEDLAVKPDPMAEPMAQMQMQAAQADLADKMANIELTLAKIEETRSAAIENIANAESDMARVALEDRKQRLDAMRTVLEDDRKRMGDLLASVRGMARAPGNGNAPQGYGAGDGAAQGVGGGGLLGGPSDFGSAQGGFGPL